MDVGGIVDMRSPAAHVGYRKHGVEGKFPLHSQAPTLRRGDFVDRIDAA